MLSLAKRGKENAGERHMNKAEKIKLKFKDGWKMGISWDGEQINRVLMVREGGKAARLGVQPGDVLCEIETTAGYRNFNITVGCYSNRLCSTDRQIVF
jgi:hypothetical protein